MGLICRGFLFVRSSESGDTIYSETCEFPKWGTANINTEGFCDINSGDLSIVDGRTCHRHDNREPQKKMNQSFRRRQGD